MQNVVLVQTKMGHDSTSVPNRNPFSWICSIFQKMRLLISEKTKEKTDRANDALSSSVGSRAYLLRFLVERLPLDAVVRAARAWLARGFERFSRS
jgi:hypothetical protein